MGKALSDWRDRAFVMTKVCTHGRDARVAMRQLEQSLLRYQEGGRAEFAVFAAAVESFVAFERNHMRSEETEVIPLAQKYLTPSDWAEIDAAFLDHTDPLLGEAVRDDFVGLFRRIVNLAPPPIGVGPAHA